MELSKDLSEFVRLMNQHEVDYLLVGGWAVSYHSVPRFTGDIDFLIRTTKKNAEAVKKVLKDFGCNSLDITVNDLIRPQFVIQLGRPPNRIDLITSIDGVTFEKAWENRTSGRIGQVTLPLISVRELILNKKSAGRPKDLMDVETLEMVQAHSSSSGAISPKSNRKRKRHKL